MEYCNYHKHDHISSIFTPDTHIKAEEYVKRAVELGHTTYFTTNHGSGGDIFEAKTLCDKYGLKCLFGIEGYIVPDPTQKDNRNYHIIIIPKTDKSRKKVNLVTSRANIEGYYYKPRIFIEDLLALEKDDIYITTACVAGIVRDDDALNLIFNPLVNHFGNNVFLEVQNHNESIQKDINRKCLDLSQKYGLRLIAANDSHYIYPEQAKDRLEYLKGKGINYGDEDSFILDYPDYDTMLARFEQQGILSVEQAKIAIENTKIFLECEEIQLDKEIKMPSIYPDYTAQEKIEELKRHINKRFAQICKDENISGEVREKYIKGIREEMQVIEDTAEINTADYFLFNEKNVDLAVNKYGGVLTRTGRGSCGSFYINRILGMTQLDRFTSPIPLYPERFVSTARLLENRAIPDIDFNVVSQEPFVKASKELLGEHGCYPMVAYGTMQGAEAFRNICRSHGLTFNEYNDIAKDIEKYKDDKKWKPLIDEAEKFIGSIVSASIHPCAHVVDNKDLREEYGVIRLGDFLCVMVTSGEADEYKLLKNDYLIVLCWKLIAETFEMIKQPIMPIVKLLENLDDSVWDMYAKGLTCTLNQCDGDWATKLLKQYKPRTVAELSMFVGALRPFFEQFRDGFINRDDYTTGSKQLDEILSATNGRILFQETLMQYFDWLGITPAESIGLIKKISKKKIRSEDFEKLEMRLKTKWLENTGSEDMFAETWSMIQSCMSYGFAAPHALATAIDSLYGAYLKVNYPFEYYTVCLNNYQSDEQRTRKLTEELDYFNIRIKPIKFRYSKDTYTPDKDNNAIYKGIASVKFLNSDVAKRLYEMKDDNFPTFIDFLKVNPCNSRQTEILILLDFFSEFGKSQKLLDIYRIFLKYAGKKQFSKSKINDKSVEAVIAKYSTQTAKMYKINDIDAMIKELCCNVKDRNVSLSDKLVAERKYLGYIEYIDEKLPKSYIYVTNLDTKYTPKFIGYCLNNGKTQELKIHKKRDKNRSDVKTTFAKLPINDGDIICVKKYKREPKCKKVGDTWQRDYNQMEWWISEYSVVATQKVGDTN